MVSIIISSFNDRENLENCLHSIQSSSYPHYEIIVIDAGSTDGTIEMLNSSFPQVKCILKKGAGVGEALNTGIRHAKGEFLLFNLNTDEMIHPNFFRELVNILVTQQRIGAICGKRYFAGTQILQSAGAAFSRWIGISKRPKNVNSHQPFEIDYAGHYMVKKELVDSGLRHDEKYFVYFEDADFCFQIRKLGYRILCVPTAISWHKVSSTTGRNKPRQYYYMRRGYFRFILKHFNPPFLVTALVAQFGYSCLMLLNNLMRKRKDYIWAELSALKWNFKNCRATILERQMMNSTLSKLRNR